ncbi:MAG: hypothetical protein ACNA8W_25510, partial [Bradymonadaceae bacterium]
DGDRIKLDFHGNGEEGIVYHIYRDGEEVASGLSQTSWTDPNSGDHSMRTYCYAVESVFASSGNRSHHSRTQCYWGEDKHRARELPLHRFRHEGGAWSTEHGRAHYGDWGRPEHVLEVSYLRPEWTGKHYIQFTYGNGAGWIPTGITAAVKEVTVTRHRDQEIVARGHVIMPHLEEWSRWGDSTLMPAELDAGEVYSVRITDSVNMSYFAHFEPYTGGTGGGGDSYNMVNITAMKLLSLGGEDHRRQTGHHVPFDGDGDLGKFDEERRIVPGAPSQEWSGFAIDWDEDYVYIAVVSEVFADPYKPFMIYLEAISGSPQAPTASNGMEYSGLTPALPFAANVAITARQLSDDGSEGPWNGIWRREGGEWRQQERLQSGQDWWLADDHHTISLRIRRASLGSPDQLRLVAHVVNAVVDNEWRDVVPADHTPWENGGGFMVIEF